MPIGTANGDYFEDGMDLRAQTRLYVTPIRDNAPEGPEQQYIKHKAIPRGPDADIPIQRYPDIDSEDKNILNPDVQLDPEIPSRYNQTGDKIMEMPPQFYMDTKQNKDSYVHPIAGPKIPKGTDPEEYENLIDKHINENHLKAGDTFKTDEENPRTYKYLGPNSGGRKDWKEIKPSDLMSGMPNVQQANFGAVVEPLTRHKVNAPEGNLLQKAVGIGTKGERYQTWPERLGRGIFHALTGMANPNIEEDKQILQGFYNTVKNAFSLPGDVYGGRIDPMSKEGIERAADLAGLMVYGPAPVASKMADGSLGSFAGVKSKTANLKALETARSVEGLVHPDDIWHEQGWFKAPDNRWKYEISDIGSHLKPEKLDMLGDDVKDLSNTKFKIPNPYLPGYTQEEVEKMSAKELTDAMSGIGKKSTYLSDLLHHPELFKAYPHLKDLRIFPLDAEGEALGWLGSYNRSTGEIQLKSGTLKDVHSVLMHEIQHAIQQHEGFSAGSNPASYATENWHSMMNEFDKIKEIVGNRISKKYPGEAAGMRYFDFYNAVANEGIYGKPYSGWTSQLSKMEHSIGVQNLKDVKRLGLYRDFQKIVKGDAIIKRHRELSETSYWRSKGEVEARNVQNRLDPNNRQYFDKHPKYTQDVPTFLQQWSPMDPAGVRDLPSASMKYPRVPKNMQEELDQLMENRRTNRLMGYDTDSPDYQYYNDRIKELQSKLAK